MISQNLAPIWLPHWPAWMWTISLMFAGCCLSGGSLKTDCCHAGWLDLVTARLAAQLSAAQLSHTHTVTPHHLTSPHHTTHLTPHTTQLWSRSLTIVSTTPAPTLPWWRRLETPRHPDSWETREMRDGKFLSVQLSPHTGTCWPVNTVRTELHQGQTLQRYLEI